MSVEVEGLNLNVTANSTNLTGVINDLNSLRTTLGKYKPDNITKLNSLGIAVKGLLTSITAIDTGKLQVFSQAVQSLSGLKQVKLSPTLSKNINSLNESLNNISDMRGLYGKVNSYTRIMSQFGSIKGTGVSNVANGIKKLQDELDKVNFKDFHGKVDSLTRILQPLADVLERIGTNAQVFPKSFKISHSIEAKGKATTSKVKKDKEPTKIEQFAESLDKKFSASTIGKVFNYFDNLKQKASELETALGNTQFGKFIDSLASIGKAIGGVISKFAQLGAKAIQIASPILNPFKGLAESVKNLNAKLKNTFNSLKRIAVYRAIRTFLKAITQGFKEGIENLYQWSKMTNGDFAPAMDRISTAMLYLKNSIGAMASPLITYLAPAIDMAVDKFVSLINVVNQLFAKITGRPTWTEALKYPKEYAEGVAGATKKIKDNIQSFDELHILTTPNDGGSGDALDYSSMFKESEIENDFANWVEDFKNAIKNGDWEGAGRILGDQVNGLFERIQWGELGKFTAEKINNVFSFAFGFLDQIDFVAIGEDVASFLNNAIETIDAETIGKTMAKKITIAVDFLYGFLKDFDFIEAGHKVSDFVNGWFEEIDGQRIGETISLAIKGALDFGITFLSDDEMIDNFVEDVVGLINGVDWYGIGVKVFNFGEKLLEAIIKVIGGILTGESYNAETGKFEVNPDISGGFRTETQSSWGTSIAEWVLGIPTDGIASAFAKILGLAFAGAVKSIEWVYDRTGITDTIGGVISDAVVGGHLDEQGNFVERDENYWKIVGNSILAEFASGSMLATDFGQTFGEALVGSLSALPAEVGVVKESLTDFHEWLNEDIARRQSEQEEETRETTRNFATRVNAFREMREKIEGQVDALRTNVHAKIGNSNVLFTNGLNGIARNFRIAFTSARTFAEDQVNYMRTNIYAKLNNSNVLFTGVLNSITKNHKLGFTNARVFAEDQVNAMRTNLNAKYGNMNKLLVDNLNNITQNTKNGFSNAKDGAIANAQEMYDKVTGIMSDLDSKMGGSADSIHSKMKNGFEATTEDVTDSWYEMKKYMKDSANAIGKIAEHVGNAVSEGFGQVADSINGMSFEIPSWVKDYGGKEFKPSLKKPGKISIPALATGGIITSPTTALVGEAGREAVLPLESNTGWIDMIANRVNEGNVEEIRLLREQNRLLTEIADKEYSISAKSVFDTVRKENKNFYTRTGRNAFAT
jgi:hypothetical protein